MSKNIKVGRNIIPFLVLKKPLYIPLYFNFWSIFLGFLYLLISFRIYRVYVPLILMIFLNVIPLINYHYFYGFLRLIQLLGIILFSNYLVKIFVIFNPIRIFKYILFLIFIIFLCEIFFIGPSGCRNFFGIILPRYIGIVGEFNFTALLLSGLSLLFLINKQYVFFILSVCMIFLTAGRGAFLPILLYFFYLFLNLFSNKKISQIYIWIIFILLAFYPCLIFISDCLLGNEFKNFLNLFSSYRYQLHVSYAILGSKSFLGYGYFNAQNFLVNLNLSFDGYKPLFLQQHNLFLQVFSDFGIVGYFLFILFLFSVVKRSMENQDLAAAFVCFLSALLFLNGLHEIILWFFVSYILYNYYFKFRFNL